MKNIIKYIAVFVLVFTLTSCEEESNFAKSDIALTPVYSVTNISGTNAPFKVNAYKQKNLMAEYESKFNLKTYPTSGYSDTSTVDDFIVEWNVTKERTVTVNNVDTKEQYIVNYKLNALKATGDGTLDTEATYQNGSVIMNSLTVKVSEEEVYN